MSYLGSVPSSGTPFSNNKIQVLSGNGSNTQFTLDFRVNSKADIEVIVNNVQQNPFDGSYDVSNNNILTFSGAPSSGANNIHIYFRGYSHNVSVPEANSINSNQLTITGVTAGTYGNTTAIPVVTIDAAGRITSATTNSVSGVTGLTYTNANTSVTVATSTVNYSANIEPGLNQAYANAVTYAGTIAATAYSNAVSVAATDASTKAATAYSNATSYADTKAATAYSNATAYADTKAATAYTNAASYADTVAATSYTNAVAYAASNTYVNNNFTKLTETRAVAISNTLASGNTTITGFANVTGSLTVGGVTTIGGNLVVNGTTVTVNTSQVNVTDSIMYLASNNEVSDSLDIGFAGHYNNGAGANGHTGLIRSAVTKKYYLFQNYQPEFFANNNVDVANVATGIQMADIVVGNLVANSTLTVTGAATFSNTVSIAGNVTGSAANVTIVAGAFTTTFANNGTTTFPGAVSGVTTLATGNTTITGFANVTSTIQGGSSLTIAGALSGVTTAAMGNTTVTGFANVSSTLQVGTSVYLNNTIASPYNNNSGTLYGTQNISLVGQWSTINWPTNYLAANTTTPWFMLGRLSGDTTFKLNIRSGWDGAAGGGDAAAWTVTPGGSNTAATIASQVWSTSSGTLSLVANGNIGVGTASPSLSSGAGIHVYNGSGTHAALKLQSAATWELLSTSAGYFSLYNTGGAGDTFSITTGGNTGIGNTAPGHKLSVNGQAYIGGNTMIYSAAGNTTLTVWPGDTASDAIIRMTGQDGNIATEGAEFHYYNMTGDIELKQTWTGISNTAAAIRFSTANFTNALTIAGGGNVGIDRATPGTKLHIYETTNNKNGANGIPTSVLTLGAYTDSNNEGPMIDFNNCWGGGYQASNLTTGWVTARIGSVYDSDVSNGGAIVFYTNHGPSASGGATSSEVTEKLRIKPNGSLLPGSNNAQDIGSSAMVWRHMYTGDLFLSNEGHEQGNDVDGTKGKWTIQEGAEDLFIINRNTGKKYRFKLEEM